MIPPGHSLPVLAEILQARGSALEVAAVDVMLQGVGTRALSVAVSEEAQHISKLGSEEAAEGLALLAASAGLAATS